MMVYLGKCRNLWGGLSLLCLVACAGSEAATQDPTELRVRPGTFASYHLLTGEMAAEDSLVLAGPNVNIWPLQIRWVVEDGTEVEAGDRMVEFDSSQLVTQLDDLVTQLLTARNELVSRQEQAAADLSDAEREVLTRQADFEAAQLEADVPEGLLAAVEMAQRQLALDRATLELKEAQEKLDKKRETTQSAIEIQRIEVEKAAVKVQRAREGIDRLALRAPRAGIALIAENRQEGRTFRNGDTTWPGNAVAYLPDLDSLVVEARLFDVDDGRITVGAPVTATLDAFPDWTLTGRIRRIDSIAQQVSRRSLRRYFHVTIDLDEIDTERMRPGMSVRVEVAAEPLEEVLLAPRMSLRFDAGKSYLRTSEGGWVEVEIGPCNAFECVVEGVEAGLSLDVATPEEA